MTAAAIIASYLLTLVGLGGTFVMLCEFETSGYQTRCLVGALLFFAISAALATVVPVWVGGGL
jgi:hypothetical protein